MHLLTRKYGIQMAFIYSILSHVAGRKINHLGIIRRGIDFWLLRGEILLSKIIERTKGVSLLLSVDLVCKMAL